MGAVGRPPHWYEAVEEGSGWRRSSVAGLIGYDVGLIDFAACRLGYSVGHTRALLSDSGGDGPVTRRITYPGCDTLITVRRVLWDPKAWRLTYPDGSPAKSDAALVRR